MFWVWQTVSRLGRKGRVSSFTPSTNATSPAGGERASSLAHSTIRPRQPGSILTPHARRRQRSAASRTPKSRSALAAPPYCSSATSKPSWGNNCISKYN
jgi:hypothetical protein